jgi:hypothetical protein
VQALAVRLRPCTLPRLHLCILETVAPTSGLSQGLTKIVCKKRHSMECRTHVTSCYSSDCHPRLPLGSTEGQLSDLMGLQSRWWADGAWLQCSVKSALSGRAPAGSQRHALHRQVVREGLEGADGVCRDLTDAG